MQREAKEGRVWGRRKRRFKGCRRWVGAGSRHAEVAPGGCAGQPLPWASASCVRRVCWEGPPELPALQTLQQQRVRVLWHWRWNTGQSEVTAVHINTWIHRTLPQLPLFWSKTAEGITFPFDLWDGARKWEGNDLCWFGSKFILPLPVLGLKDFLSQPATNTHEGGGAHPLSLLVSSIFLFVFKVLPSQCSPRGSGLFPLHYKVNRKESSLWLLVSICSWCPWYWQPPVCVPDDYCSKGPFSKGEALLSTKILLFSPINPRSCLHWPSVSIWLMPMN